MAEKTLTSAQFELTTVITFIDRDKKGETRELQRYYPGLLEFREGESIFVRNNDKVRDGLYVIEASRVEASLAHPKLTDLIQRQYIARSRISS